MSSAQANSAADRLPALSLVMPCYNEEDVVEHTVTQLLTEFERVGHSLELVLVDNGSSDHTGEILETLAAAHPNIVRGRVDVNQGYGFGVLTGLPLARAPWVGMIVADGQVDATDVAKLFDITVRARSERLAKVRRRFRTETIGRRIVSMTYNLAMRMLFGNLGTGDINASPKIIPRAYLERMNLQSKDWFLDAEAMIKAKRLSLPIFELSIFARMRPDGTSNVHASTCWEFVINLLSFRFGKKKAMLDVVPFEKGDAETERLPQPDCS